MMRTTLTIDDTLSKDVIRYTRSKNLAAAVHKAVADYVRRQKLAGILELRGKIKFEDAWDYKAGR
jgi:Arc/MetJ family transcription regulator